MADSTWNFTVFLILFHLVSSQFNGPPISGNSGIPPKPPAETSNTTVDVQINTGNVTATVRGLQFSYGKSYRGIPYAQPPIGKLRFDYAHRKDPSGIVKALEYGAACSQKPMKMDFEGKKSAEDCLFINVFTPLNVTKDSQLPVYMFYHYGGHVGGNGNLDEGIFPNLVNRGPIIMVSMNYRVGPFGFFTTRDSTASGNWATSDWIESLNWVNRYISFFGGDPKRITIGGQSAGAESVSAITMTPLSKLLYNQVIQESGSVFDATIMSYSEKTRNSSEYLTIALNCSSKKQWEDRNMFTTILACLRNRTSSEIMAADDSLPDHRSKWSLVEDDKYFRESLESLAMKRDNSIKVLIGNVNSEWIFFEDRSYMTTNVNNSRNTASRIEKDLAASYEISYYSNPKQVLSAAENALINRNGISENDHVGWEAKRLQLWSEMVFIGPVLRDASFYRTTGNTVYLYSLDWLSSNALLDVTERRLRGVSHGTELTYLFETSCQFYNCTSGDNLLRQYISTTWVNFIKLGNPSPSGSSLPFRWLPMDRSNRFLSFSPTPKMESNYHSNSSFWACIAPQIDGYNGPFCQDF
ncbi:hypothetical protein CRE_18129 [Caenorhabditis remanei]|uniref:Carboxylic ester hydrolase n=1 Tax=Caenorhabditis remanei TaxID=31234 RepID=E3N329_CAERE|nr:hypothetical protein CRE_18129 [Caenorhabditis remanei]